MREPKTRHPDIEETPPADPRERLNRAAAQLHGGHRAISFTPAPDGVSVEQAAEGADGLRPPAPLKPAPEQDAKTMEEVKKRLREEFGGRWF